MLTHARATLVQSCICVLYLTIYKLNTGMEWGWESYLAFIYSVQVAYGGGGGMRQYAHATNIHDLTSLSKICLKTGPHKFC